MSLLGVSDSINWNVKILKLLIENGKGENNDIVKIANKIEAEMHNVLDKDNLRPRLDCAYDIMFSLVSKGSPIDKETAKQAAKLVNKLFDSIE